jgi:DNA-binding SARP family transcriptional activator/TolB-like protein
LLHLRTFGGLSLDRDGDQPVGIPVRKRHLALLALLASHRDQGMSRDKVIAYLWPESDTAHARNSLKQTLFTLRKLLGAALLSLHDAILRLDASAIQVDLWEFESALSRGDHAGMVRAYAGPYLDGFYVKGLAEFERWVESERRRLAELRAGALRQLGQAADASLDHVSAVEWWRQLVAMEPFSSSATVALMRALAAAGDPLAAIEHATRHAALVSAELDLAPDQEVLTVAEQLRRELGQTPPRSTPRAWASPPRVPGYGRRQSDVIPAAAAPPALVPLVATAATPRAHIVGALLLALIAIGISALNGRVAPSQPAANPAAVLVLPFETSGGDAATELAAGIQHLLATSLDGADDLRSVPLNVQSRRGTRLDPVDPRQASALAHKAGARLYVVGRVVAQGGRLRASAVLYDRANVNVPVGRAEAEAASVFGVVDQLAMQLIAERYRGADRRLARTAAMTTGSVVALKAYLEGDRLLRMGRYPAAAEAVELAVMADNSFALAYYRLSEVAELRGQPDLALRAAEQATRVGDRLSEHDRSLVEAHAAYRSGRLNDAERLYRRIVAEYSEDANAWFGLGEVLFRRNPLHGRSSSAARGAFERAAALDSLNARALIYLARIAWVDGERARADSLVDRVTSIASDSAALDLSAVLAFSLPDRSGHAEIARSLDPPARRSVAATALQVAVYFDDLARHERLANALNGDGMACEVDVLRHRILAQAALARGALRTALTHLAGVEQCDPAGAIELGALFASFPFVPRDGKELTALQRILGRPLSGSRPTRTAGSEQPVRFYGLGLLALRQQDTLLGRRWQRRLAGSSDTTRAGELAATMAASLRARAMLVEGRKAAALRAIEAADWERAATPSLAEVSDRYLRAVLLEELGQEEEAIGVFRSIAERSADELPYLAPAQYRLGRIYERRREPAEAASRYRRFIELWEECDPALQPLVTDARRRLHLIGGS